MDYFTKTELKTRGWSEALISRLLKKPDFTKQNPRNKRWPPMQLYLRYRVLRLEQTDCFRTRPRGRRSA